MSPDPHRSRTTHADAENENEDEVCTLHNLLWDSLIAFGASSGYATVYPADRN
ncbi:MAG: hypothetical protein K0U60_01920 [Actinomycetia bacterium]|nr:hypothetical protein [Actinomycetes bacterium]MCH9800932.1 hypothetical protein [Actinomycetes bacterium]